MIARLWHGWTAPDDADAYAELLRTRVLPGFEGREGYRGAFVLRRVEAERAEEVGFVTITLFDDMAGVRAFSGDGDRGAVVPSEARALLTRFDGRSSHYEIVQDPESEP